MIQVLLDINVILDVMQNRDEHYEDAAKVMSLCSNNHIKGYGCGSFATTAANI